MESCGIVSGYFFGLFGLSTGNVDKRVDLLRVDAQGPLGAAHYPLLRSRDNALGWHDRDCLAENTGAR